MDIGDKKQIRQDKVGIEPFYGIKDQKKYFHAIEDINGVKKVNKKNNISPKELREWLEDKNHKAIILVSTRKKPETGHLCYVYGKDSEIIGTNWASKGKSYKVLTNQKLSNKNGKISFAYFIEVDK